MKVKIESIRTIKPIYKGIISPTIASHSIPLSIFDKVTFNTHVAVIYAYSAPTPPNATIEHGLKRALSEYREWAGRLGENENGDTVIFLNDKGVKLVEASIDSKLDQFLPLQPSPLLLSLHPSLKDVEELLQVQLTRSTCGSLAIGVTSHHLVADGHSTINFLIDWAKATKGLEINPLPLHDRTIFIPQNPPHIEFEHRGVDFRSKKLVKDFPNNNFNNFMDDIVVCKVHFTLEFLSMLKASSSPSSPNNKPYTTFDSLVAHLWRSITKVRELNGFETTHVRIFVNGRMRMSPKVPNEYFGNLVLWAFPSSRVKNLLHEPLSHATKLIHEAIANVNDNYFKSFINFATHKTEKEEDQLVPTPDVNKSVLCPNLEIVSWLNFPFSELYFGGGSPRIFMPSYFPYEGTLFLLPSIIGDGSIDAFVHLFQNNLAAFKEIVYSLDLQKYQSLPAKM